MDTLSTFPRELLKQDVRERLSYFRNYTIAHPRLRETFTSFYNTLQECAPGTIIFLFGPTGAGKTTLRLAIEREITKILLTELETNKWRLPIVGIPAASSETGIFNWKDFYRRLLFALDEPCVDKKIWPNKIFKSNDYYNYPIGFKAAGIELRFAAEKALSLRQPMALLIDDAQHIAKVGSGKRIQNQLDCIKSLADITQIPIGLFGTYELLAFRNLSAQLSRRSIDIHLMRYRSDVEVDIKVFKNVLGQFQRHLPLSEEPDLTAEWDYFYERSIGCIGILKDWLYKALVKAINDKRQQLKTIHLQSTHLSVSQCEKMLTDAIEGETKLQETVIARSHLRKRLGLNSLNKESADCPTNNDDSNDQFSISKIEELSVPKQKKSRKPGQRNPQRDPIGTIKNAKTE